MWTSSSIWRTTRSSRRSRQHAAWPVSPDGLGWDVHHGPDAFGDIRTHDARPGYAPAERSSVRFAATELHSESAISSAPRTPVTTSGT